MTASTLAPAVQALAAAAPIGVILVLMLGLRWSALRAGLAGLLLAWLLALQVFGFGSSPAGGDTAAAGPLAQHLGVLAEGSFLALGILWILLPALTLHGHQQRCGALDAVRAGLARVSSERPLQALLVGWCLALFLEGAAGFGTPMALAAPILVGLGVPPLQAVVLSLLGHAVGVSFGALGTPVLAQVALTGADAVEIAWRTALLHAVLGGVLMLFFKRTLAATGLGAAAAGWAGLAVAAFVLPSLVLAARLGPELATLAPALSSAVAVMLGLHLRARWRARVDSGPAGSDTAGHAAAIAPPRSDSAALWRALWPYLLLIVLVLITRALPPVAQALGTVLLQWELFGHYRGSLAPLTHPGTLLFVALLLGCRLQGVPLRELAQPLAQAARRLLPVTLALLAMLCLSRLLLHAGMIGALEQAVVGGVGRAWPLLAPSLGALGSFVTGSATASNVLFSSLQAQTAQALGLPVAALLAAQGFGAAIGNIICPHNIVAGAATVGLAGREAEILRRTLWPCLLYLGLGGVLVALLLALG